MSIIDQINEEIREIFAQDVISEGDIRRIGYLEQQLERALIRYDY